MSLAPGTRLGPYEILAPLGAGGMGEVYRAHDPRLERDVALKIMPPHLSSSAELRSRFEREARAVAALNHPNIVTIFSVEEADGLRYLTMELVDGHSLTDIVTAGGLPLRRVLELTIPIADALVAAHEKGIVHRDLKPGNVMLTREGRIKVMDFGLAKRATEAPLPDIHETQAATMTAPITGAGLMVGTVPYMAPEQLRGDAVDARTDVFALGVMMYELATGRRPFSGASASDIISAILRDPPEPLTSVRPDVTRDLGRIVDRCLEKDASERFQTARDVYNELRILKRDTEATPSRTTPTAAVVAPAIATEDTPSIAVLPFVNLSRDEENEYFADGLAEELLNVLSKVKRLRVAARTSSFSFKGRQADIETIGRQLRVKSILEGSVRRAGKRVRITAQLVQVSDGFHLWSETYDRELEDIFAVQDDIAQAVVKELRSTLLGERPDTDAAERARAEVQAAASGRAANAEAYQELMLARHFERRFTPADHERAVTHYRRAIDLDPGYALAWAGLAGVHTIQAGYGWVNVDEGHRLSRKAVDKALALDPDLPEAHAVLGAIQLRAEWDLKGAAASFAHAVRGSPGNAELMAMVARYYVDVGRLREAESLILRAVELDPLSTRAHRVLAHCYWREGRLAEAEATCKRALEVQPEAPVTRIVLGAVILDRGRPEEALAVVRDEPDPIFRAVGEAIALYGLGRKQESEAALAKVKEGAPDYAAVQIAYVHAYRGENDEAFEWLERARASRDTGLSEVAGMPLIRKLHGDPRWRQFLERIGFTD